MLEVVYKVVTWGLLGLFVAFIAYGVAITVYTLSRFYLTEFAKLSTRRPSKPSE